MFDIKHKLKICRKK